MNSVFGCDVQNFQKTKGTARHYKHGIKEPPMMRKIFLTSELSDVNPHPQDEPVNGINIDSVNADAQDTQLSLAEIIKRHQTN